MMKLRVSILTCLLLTSMLLVANWVLAADDDKEKEEDKWGDAKLDHKLNVPWEYPADYTKQPLVFSKRVTEFGVLFDYKDARHYYDEDGVLTKGSFRTKRETLNLSLGMGFTDKWTVKINFPFVYKKTQITDPKNQNYRRNRSNTYGALAEEAFVDFFDNHEIWKLWEADLPSMGDVDLWTAYSIYQKLDPTTSFTIEFNYKAPTGNDNPRRGSKVRNFLTTGTPDFYTGLGFKQQAWKFSFEGHAGYNCRLKAATKYSAGKIDLADQLLAHGEVAFQVPEAKPFLKSWALIARANYMQRLDKTTFFDSKSNTARDLERNHIGNPAFFGRSTLYDKNGNAKVIEDAPGYAFSVEPKIIYQAHKAFFEFLSGDYFFSADIPIAGQRSFLVQSRSDYLPPWELETYEAVGITYKFGLIKRWQ